MAVHIRFQRVGKKKKPMYRLIAIDSRRRRDGKPLEILGNYNPFAKGNGLVFKKERVQYWISVGALTSDRVRTTLNRTDEWKSLKGTST